MDDNYYAVIMAGGSGTRLWPVSRQKNPKQLLRISGNKSLFQIAIDRLEGLFSTDHIIIVTGSDHSGALQEECPQIPKHNYLIEPAPRGTASVVGLAAIYLKYLDKNAKMAVLTADHMIENVDLFHNLVKRGMTIADNNFLVTLGIEPTYPSTGYGYIESGNSLGIASPIIAKEVIKFIEKPNEEKAKEFIKRGGYYWNSGMFFWKVDQILEEFKKQMPVLMEFLDLIYAVMGTPQYGEVLDNVWKKISPQTIDYGIMEHASGVAVLPAIDLGWSDVGSWDSLFDFLVPDDDGNVIIGDNNFVIRSRNNLIKKADQNRLSAIIGIEGLVVIDTEDALLICKRGETQSVRQIVEMLRKKDLQKYL